MSQQINLIDPTLRVKHDWLAARGIVGVAALLGVAVGAHWAYEHSLLNRTLAAAAVPPPVADPAASSSESPLQEAQRVVAQGERLMQAVAGLTNLPRDNAQRLRAVVAAMPGNLWLQEVEFSSERGVRVVGGATDAAALTGFAQRLGELPALRGTPLFVFKVEPRALSQSGGANPEDAQQPDPNEQRPPHYAFVLSTLDNESAR